MNENSLKISDELIENLSLEEIAELKIEMDDLFSKLDYMIECCDETLDFLNDI